VDSVLQHVIRKLPRPSCLILVFLGSLLIVCGEAHLPFVAGAEDLQAGQQCSPPPILPGRNVSVDVFIEHGTYALGETVSIEMCVTPTPAIGELDIRPENSSTRIYHIEFGTSANPTSSATKLLTASVGGTWTVTFSAQLLREYYVPGHESNIEVRHFTVTSTTVPEFRYSALLLMSVTAAAAIVCSRSNDGHSTRFDLQAELQEPHNTRLYSCTRILNLRSRMIGSGRN
jgi:hypothetical protein